MSKLKTQNPDGLDDLVGRMVIKDFKPYRVDQIKTYQNSNGEIETILSYVDVEKEMDEKAQMNLVDENEV